MSAFYDKLRKLIFAPRPYSVSLYIKVAGSSGRFYWEGTVMAQSKVEAEKKARDEAMRQVNVVTISVKRDRSLETKLKQDVANS